MHCCEQSELENLTLLFIPNGHWLRTFVFQKEAQTISNDEAIKKILLNITYLFIYV